MNLISKTLPALLMPFILLASAGMLQAAATETVLYSFAGGGDGTEPTYGLTSDKEGNLYGTTAFGGDADAGTVFELKRSGSGWIHTILYSFTGNTDGAVPSSGVVFDGKEIFTAPPAMEDQTIREMSTCSAPTKKAAGLRLSFTASLRAAMEDTPTVA
jgi:uncharacterized repeat protein (TIGR03803 family)